MPFIQTNQYNIHYQEFNKEAPETIIMIHGINSNMSVFYFKIAPILADYYHVVLYDMKGHGLSGLSQNGYDLAGMVSDLVFLMNELNIKKSHIVGYSYGGLIALKMALLHPLIVQKIVVIDSPLMEQILEDQNSVNEEELVKDHFTKYIESMAFQPKKRHLERSKQTIDLLLNNTSFIEDFFEKNKLFTAELELNTISHKTLLLYADQSGYTPSGHKLEAIIPTSEFKIGKGDHNLPLHNPAWIISNVIEFIN